MRKSSRRVGRKVGEVTIVGDERRRRRGGRAMVVVKERGEGAAKQLERKSASPGDRGDKQCFGSIFGHAPSLYGVSVVFTLSFLTL